MYRPRQIKRYQAGGWAGDRNAINLMHANGKKYSYNQLAESGLDDSTIIRNWNLNLNPEPKTTMAKPVGGFEQRPVQQTMTRGDAFKQARQAGENVFEFEGKKYTTEVAQSKPKPTQTPAPAVPVKMEAQPYISPYRKPYENMSKEKLQSHIKNNWTQKDPYYTTAGFGDSRISAFVDGDEVKDSGFELQKHHEGKEEFFDSRGEHQNYQVLNKNGQGDRAATIAGPSNSRHNGKPENVKRRIFNAFNNASRMDLESLKTVAGELDSTYNASPTYKPPGGWSRTVLNKNTWSKMMPWNMENHKYVPPAETSTTKTRPKKEVKEKKFSF